MPPRTSHKASLPSLAYVHCALRLHSRAAGCTSAGGAGRHTHSTHTHARAGRGRTRCSNLASTRVHHSTLQHAVHAHALPRTAASEGRRRGALQIAWLWAPPVPALQVVLGGRLPHQAARVRMVRMHARRPSFSQRPSPAVLRRRSPHRLSEWEQCRGEPRPPRLPGSIGILVGPSYLELWRPLCCLVFCCVLHNRRRAGGGRGSQALRATAKRS